MAERNMGGLVQWWNDPPLVASKLAVGICSGSHVASLEPHIGIDMEAEDGSAFGHAHFNLEGAVAFHQMLGLAIEELKHEAGITPASGKGN